MITRDNKKARHHNAGLQTLYYSDESAGLTMESLLAATRAELHQLETVRSVATILRRDVIALLADGAGERDTRTNIVLCHLNTSHN
jgi:hypothetical protein